MSNNNLDDFLGNETNLIYEVAGKVASPTYSEKSVVPQGVSEAHKDHYFKTPRTEGRAVQCMDCKSIEVPNRNGNCATCGSSAVTDKVYVGKGEDPSLDQNLDSWLER